MARRKSSRPGRAGKPDIPVAATADADNETDELAPVVPLSRTLTRKARRAVRGLTFDEASPPPSAPR